MNRRALIAAGVTGTLGFLLLGVYEHRLEKETSGGAKVEVVVVTRDLPRGTLLSREVLGFRAVPEAYLESRHVTRANLEQVLGGRLDVSLRASESLSLTDLTEARQKERLLSGLVEPGMRAMAVSANTFGGLLRPGDRVDVVARLGATMAPALENLVVLAVGSDTTGSDPRDVVDATITLGGTPSEVQELARLSGNGPVTLSLRNPDDVVRLASAAPVAPESPPRRNPEPRVPEIEHVQ